ncbi:MAG: FxsA family protein [SAR324 cluster bacterium]|nr:FxsA family protein [SAR324 cluster bacterium]
MSCLLFFLFLIIPIIEIWILFQVGNIMPLLSIFFICIATGGFGLWLMRTEDISLWTLLESEFVNKRLPTEELLDAILLYFAGVDLLIPGFMTDAIGFALILPHFRNWIVVLTRKYLKNKLQ